MTAIAAEAASSKPSVGERVELGRYTISDGGERVLVGQRVDGVVRLVDVPASGCGRAYLVERGLEQDGNAGLQAVVADYLHQARLHDQVPLLICPLDPAPNRDRRCPGAVGLRLPRLSGPRA